MASRVGHLLKVILSESQECDRCPALVAELDLISFAPVVDHDDRTRRPDGKGAIRERSPQPNNLVLL